MDQFYVVRGMATNDLDGETCYRQWLVVVYPEEETAQQHANLANEAMVVAMSSIDGVSKWHHHKIRDFAKVFPYDSKLRGDDREVCYWVEQLDIALHVDDYQERLRF